MRHSTLPCPKCGSMGVQAFKPITFKSRIGRTSSTPNYCSKCGKALRGTCTYCHGTGKTMVFVSFNRDRYCSECGRELPPPDDTCPHCEGTGEWVEPVHVCI